MKRRISITLPSGRTARFVCDVESKYVLVAEAGSVIEPRWTGHKKMGEARTKQEAIAFAHRLASSTDYRSVRMFPTRQDAAECFPDLETGSNVNSGESDMATKKKSTKKTASKKKTTSKKAAAKSNGEGRPTGKTTGLGIQQAWAHIFAQNEKAAKKDRLTDEQISKWLHKEFPGRDSAVFDAVNSVRTRYNNGDFTDGSAPAKQSQPYDANGDVTTGRISKRGGTNDEAPAAATSKKSSTKKSSGKKSSSKKKSKKKAKASAAA